MARVIWEYFHNSFDSHKCEYNPSIVLWSAYVKEMKIALAEGVALKKSIDMRNWPLLVLDDIFNERDPNGFGLDELNTLLSCRVGKWTVLTANVFLESIAAHEARIASRIIREPGNILVEVDAIDYAMRTF